MYYVYISQYLAKPGHYYSGFTGDLKYDYDLIRSAYLSQPLFCRISNFEV